MHVITDLSVIVAGEIVDGIIDLLVGVVAVGERVVAVGSVRITVEGFPHELGGVDRLINFDSRVSRSILAGLLLKSSLKVSSII